MNSNKTPATTRILLVEDNEHDRFAFGRALKKGRLCCEITECVRAEEALEIVRSGDISFNLLVVDHGLPGISGLELCKELLAEGTPLPLVILTGAGSQQLAVEALKAGVYDYIIKDPGRGYLNLLPVVLPDVVRRHKERLAREQAEAELQKAHAELEIRVAQRTTALARANQELRNEISERRRAEEALGKSEEKYRTLIENIQDGVFIIQDLKLQFVNEAFIKMVGYPATELTDMDFRQLIAPEDVDMVVKRYRRGQSGENVRSEYEFRMLHKDGVTRIFVNMSVGFVEFRGNIAGMGTVKDITERWLVEKERQRLEAQLQHAQKMEAVGTMAGGIAHDFNNLLMGIQGLTSLVMFDIDPAHPHIEHLREIEECVKSAADLTNQILGFARGGKYEIKPTDLNELIESNSQMFGRTKKELNIFKEYQKSVWTVAVDQGQIGQVLMNLFVNAWQAMPGGGSLSITTENIDLDDHYVKPFQVSPGRYVKFSVRDTGLGMDETIQRRIFEPFFTTKEMGRGTGLGLATVYGIVKNHGGFIEVDSRKGEGTTFKVYLPAIEIDVAEEKKAVQELVHGCENVLLVDDEDLIIDVGQRLLSRMGYSVLVARDGAEAIEIYRKRKNEIEMVILDMIMPDMSGGEVYDRLSELNPSIKVLLSSGYSLSGQASDILARGCKGFIQKPFNMRELSHKLREVIEG
ncbi:MAG: response regulator [Desulfobacterales bacterium]|jgi:PAS domain S-box-containing protein